MYDPYFKRSVWTDSEKCNVYSVSDRWDRWAGYRTRHGHGDCQSSGGAEGTNGIWGTVGSGVKMRFYLSSKKRLYPGAHREKGRYCHGHKPAEERTEPLKPHEERLMKEPRCDRLASNQKP